MAIRILSPEGNVGARFVGLAPSPDVLERRADPAVEEVMSRLLGR